MKNFRNSPRAEEELHFRSGASDSLKFFTRALGRIPGIFKGDRATPLSLTYPEGEAVGSTACLIPPLGVRGGEGELWILAVKIERKRKMLERVEVPCSDIPAGVHISTDFSGISVLQYRKKNMRGKRE